MARKRGEPKIYTRTQGGAVRYYANFIPIGGGREALKVKGEKLATTDPVIAAKLFADRLQELQEMKRNRVLLGADCVETLQAFAAAHLIEKAKSGRYATRWLAQAQRHLDEAIAFFGAERNISTIHVDDVERYVEHLRNLRNGRNGTLSAGTQRHYLNSLSNLFRRAQSKRAVPLGHNPVAAMMEKPTAARREAEWLEIHDAALLLEAARTFTPRQDIAPAKRAERGTKPIATPASMMHALIATMLLTGGRKAEVLGLEVEDVSFDRRTITFRPNRWRRLKSATSHRTVPLWPQLEEILRAYMFGGDTPRVSGLLFASHRSGAMMHDFDKSLDSIAERAGWKRGEVRAKQFRHTYCAARLQTLDRGAPVSEFTVARELGHGGTQLVRRVYGHLGTIRHRSELVEYRVANHMDVDGYTERVQQLLASQ